MTLDDNQWQELRAILAEEPSELAFRAACSIIDTWHGDDIDATLAYASEALSAWPDEHRRASWMWNCTLSKPDAGRSGELVRTADMLPVHLGYEPIELRNLPDMPMTSLWTRLDCFWFDEDAPAVLTKEPERWSSLQTISRLGVEDAKALEAFFASRVFQNLKSLELYYSSLAGYRKEQLVLPPLAKPAARLQSLGIPISKNINVSPILSVDLLPGLRELSLEGDWFDYWNMASSPDWLLGIASLPLMSQLNSLIVKELPVDVMQSLLARSDLRLERLEICNRRYSGLVEEQESAVRLNTEIVEAIIRSSLLEHLTHLSIANERIENSVLRLVEACIPGQLVYLRLQDIGLTDEGAKRLAQMPQLSNVRHLDLQENKLTAKGVATLLASPHLTNLQYLDLGGGDYNPYYGPLVVTQPLGDEGAAVLARSDVLSSLHTLRLQHALVGTSGAEALAHAHIPHLRVLDLSHNAIQSEGAQSLLASTLVSPLHTLSLMNCRLDDRATDYVKRAAFEGLRVLNLSYNSVSHVGAKTIAEAANLSSLWHLNLHDNFVGDDGLIALAQSPYLSQLVELDLEQDVWNYHRSNYGMRAAETLAEARVFSRLDALHLGVVDEYHGGRSSLPFPKEAMLNVTSSKSLRAEVRYGLVSMNVPKSSEKAETHLTSLFKPEELEKIRLGNDFRNRPPKGIDDEAPHIRLTKVPYG